MRPAAILVGLLLAPLVMAVPVQASHSAGQAASTSGLDDLAGPDRPPDPPTQPNASDLEAAGNPEPIATNAQAALRPGQAGDNGRIAWVWALPLTVLGLGSVLVVRRRTHRADAPAQAPDTVEAVPDPATTHTAPSPGASTPHTPPTTAALPPGVDGILKLALEAVQQDAIGDAVTWFETAIAVQPRLPVAHFCLGLCLYEQARYEEAAETFGHAATLEPANPMMPFNRARALCQLDRFEEATTELSPVLAAYPGMLDQVCEDPAFRGLRDHPRYLSRLQG